MPNVLLYGSVVFLHLKCSQVICLLLCLIYFLLYLHFMPVRQKGR
jgi:hypothetical protein